MPHAASNGHLGRLATGAAFGFMAGLALPHARKAMMQAPSVAAGDWADALMAEHRMVEKAFQALLATETGDHMKREMLLTKIAYALTKHGIEEENVIYPAIMENGREEMARHLVEDHGQIKTFIFELRRLGTEEAGWLDKAQGFFECLQHHIREEEEEVFPAFREALPAQENARLTKMMNWEGFKVA
jgi:hemerythrin superfamily protein